MLHGMDGMLILMQHIYYNLTSIQKRVKVETAEKRAGVGEQPMHS